MTRRQTDRGDDDAGHTDRWYDQSRELVELQPGERLFIACEGGPSVSRLVTYPPPLEIAERGGLYVLIDDGARDDWSYLFVPDEGG